MPEYQCPQCNGGFPDPKPTDTSPECPWCGTKLNSDYGTPPLGLTEGTKDQIQNTTSSTVHLGADDITRRESE